MKTFEQIDGWVISICTKISHYFQELTGRTNYFIAKIGIYLASLETMMEIANYFHKFLWRKTDLIMAICCLLINLSLFHDAINLDKADSASQFSEERVLPATLRSTSAVRRLIWLSWVLFDTFALILAHKTIGLDVLNIAAQLFFSYGLAIFYYFIAVQPLRPGKSRIRQWIEKFSFGLLKPVPVTNE